MFDSRATLVLPEAVNAVGPVEGGLLGDRRLLSSFLQPDVAGKSVGRLYAAVYGVDLSSFSVTVRYADCPSPCLNGGICRFKSAAVSTSECDCSGLAFTGDACTETAATAGIEVEPVLTPEPTPTLWDAVSVGY
jgi:hypothetical protein